MSTSSVMDALLSPPISHYRRDWQTETPEEMSLPARASLGERAAAWIVPFWNFSEGPMDLAVIANGCGVGVESPVNYDLKSLVRIYPNDTFALSLSLPPFRKWEKEREKRHWGKSKMESESTSVSALERNNLRKKSERDDHKGELKYTTGRYVSGHYEESEASYDKEARMEQETRRTDYSAGGLLSLTTKGDEDYSSGSVGTSLELTLAHNGASVDPKKEISGPGQHRIRDYAHHLIDQRCYKASPKGGFDLQTRRVNTSGKCDSQVGEPAHPTDRNQVRDPVTSPLSHTSMLTLRSNCLNCRSNSALDSS